MPRSLCFSRLRSIPARAIVAAGVTALALALASPSAQAVLFPDDDARAMIRDTNNRLNALQKQIEDRLTAIEGQLKAQGLVDMLNQLEQLRSDVARLRGQIEVNAYELEQQQKRQRDLYVDLDTRVRKLESAQAATATPPQPPADAGAAGNNATPGGAASAGAPTFGPPPPAGGQVTGSLAPTTAAPPARPSDPVAEQRAYDAALDQFKRGDYNGAISGFSTFVRNYPRSPLASSAQYWIGNAQYAKRDYRASIAAQRQLVKDYPDSPKIPDALLNIASAQADMGDNGSARRTLEELMRNYPQTDAAQKARQRLGMR
ncbi:MAG TPA: tol-pal system protein YbgF [Casimicrobiaceae bacterium]|nr:tol-pal system protein YbgF [Casimicrobiaceae bacterium]